MGLNSNTLGYMMDLDDKLLPFEQLRLDAIQRFNKKLDCLSIMIEPIGYQESVITYKDTRFHRDTNQEILDLFDIWIFKDIGAAYVSKEIIGDDLFRFEKILPGKKIIIDPITKAMEIE